MKRLFSGSVHIQKKILIRDKFGPPSAAMTTSLMSENNGSALIGLQTTGTSMSLPFDTRVSHRIASQRHPSREKNTDSLRSSIPSSNLPMCKGRKGCKFRCCKVISLDVKDDASKRLQCFAAVAYFADNADSYYFFNLSSLTSLRVVCFMIKQI